MAPNFIDQLMIFWLIINYWRGFINWKLKMKYVWRPNAYVIPTRSEESLGISRNQPQYSNCNSFFMPALQASLVIFYHRPRPLAWAELWQPCRPETTLVIPTRSEESVGIFRNQPQYSNLQFFLMPALQASLVIFYHRPRPLAWAELWQPCRPETTLTFRHGVRNLFTLWNKIFYFNAKHYLIGLGHSAIIEGILRFTQNDRGYFTTFNMTNAIKHVWSLSLSKVFEYCRMWLQGIVGTGRDLSFETDCLFGRDILHTPTA